MVYVPFGEKGGESFPETGSMAYVGTAGMETLLGIGKLRGLPES